MDSTADFRVVSLECDCSIKFTKYKKIIDMKGNKKKSKMICWL